MSHVPQLTKLEALLARLLERRELPRTPEPVQSALSSEPEPEAFARTPVDALPAVEAVGVAEAAPEAIHAEPAPAPQGAASAVQAEERALEVSAERPASSAEPAALEELEEEVVPESEVEPPAATLASTQQHLAAVVPLPSRAVEVQLAAVSVDDAAERQVPPAEVSHARLTDSGREVQGSGESPVALQGAAPEEPVLEEATEAVSAVEPPVSSARSVDPSVEDESRSATDAPPESTPLSSPAPKVASEPQQVEAQLAAAAAAEVVEFGGELPLARRSVRSVLARALAL